MASTATAATKPLYSALAKDPDLREIVEMFVQEMPGRVSSLLERVDASDWEGLRRAAHQLKGAAGSYGFEPITCSAARLETAIRESQPKEQIHQLAEQLVGLCRRAEVGPPV